ncbi:MAG: oligopeptidase A [Planctomycetota bacterium]|jgi:oligopeptidase A
MSKAVQAPQNPLLAPTGIAVFQDFRAEHVEPGVIQLLTEMETALTNLEQNGTPTWEGVVEPLERIGDRLGFVWGLVSHLMSVQNAPDLREAHDKMQPKMIEFYMKLGQSRLIYDKLQELRDGDGWKQLVEGQQRAVNALLHDARLTGVALEGTTKERFNKLQQELAELSSGYSNNVLDSNKAFKLELKDKEEVEGLPQSSLALAAQSSEVEGASPEKGPWRITLDAPSFGPFLQHSKRRDLREKIYKAYVTRASTGDQDNTQAILDILAKRRESASILGYDNWAQVSLSSKMAPDVAAANKLLEELRVVARPAAEKDLQGLVDFAAEQNAPEAKDMQPWDTSFWSERVREARYDFSQEELRPYLPMSKVLEGLFSISKKLFGATVEEATGSVPGWNDDVTYYLLKNDAGEAFASFFLDPYARPANKRGGAWMNDGLGRSQLFPTEDGTARLPVAYIVCNFTPPIGDKPALLTFGEVETMFHEFGHALQHMMTKVDHGLVSGIENVEWDAVELPSQFMENWCYHQPTLMGMTGHIETGESMPNDLFDKIVAARTFNSGIGTTRQLNFAILDLVLHDEFDPAGDESIIEVTTRIADKTSVGNRFEGSRPLNAFGHIFAGGYAAGYYSYKWAEVLSADAFAAFEEAGLDNAEAIEATGKRFAETVLALGGSRAPMDVFKDFRGREPETAALLRHSGLA